MGIGHMRADRGAQTKGPDGQVGHIVVVHHVEVHQIGARCLDGAHLLSQARKVGRQD
jgi:hypothetical protein